MCLSKSTLFSDCLFLLQNLWINLKLTVLNFIFIKNTTKCPLFLCDQKIEIEMNKEKRYHTTFS